MKPLTRLLIATCFALLGVECALTAVVVIRLSRLGYYESLALGGAIGVLLYVFVCLIIQLLRKARNGWL